MCLKPALRRLSRNSAVVLHCFGPFVSIRAERVAEYTYQQMIEISGRMRYVLDF